MPVGNQKSPLRVGGFNCRLEVTAVSGTAHVARAGISVTLCKGIEAKKMMPVKIAQPKAGLGNGITGKNMQFPSRILRRPVPPPPPPGVMFFLGLLILSGLVNVSISNLGAMIHLLNCTDFPPNTNQTIMKDGKLDTRLPRTLRPLHYLVKLQPFINGNFSISGYMEVEMEVLEPTSSIILHMADIITKNETVKLWELEEGRSIRVTEQEYIREYQFYVARLEEPLERGAKYALAMEFVGYLSDELYGFYRLSYRDADGDNQYLAVTQFQPTHARRAFPCFDEPALKATFEVHLARETWMTSLSNMPLAETRPVEGQEGWVWDRFERSVPMSTYLVAFVVSDFVHINATVDDRVLLRVWARESTIEDAKYASEIAAKILRFFEEYFGIPYPLKKLDIVALPDLTSDMENWGLITYRENSVLYNAESPIKGDKSSMIEAVAHELAHQWFGNLVTPKWWDDTWLNEGFATYMSVLGAAATQPEALWEGAEAAGVRMLQQVFWEDSLQSSHKISIPVCHRDDINENFDSISYLKGASIIRMMSHFLGQATFKKGLNNYLNSFKYSNAAQDDLWEYLTDAAHQDGRIFDFDTIKMFMDPWTLQKGYPVVRLAWSADRTSGIITQEHFLSENRNLSDTHDYKWWIPLTFTTRSRADFNRTQIMVWLRDYWESLNITYFSAEDEWIIFNLQQTGYYRVNYDDHNWNLLIQQLKDDHKVIHVFNRAQIIDDAMNLAKAGHLSYKVALGVYTYLSKETEHLPRTVAAENMKYLVAMLRGTAAFGALKVASKLQEENGCESWQVLAGRVTRSHPAPWQAPTQYGLCPREPQRQMGPTPCGLCCDRAGYGMSVSHHGSGCQLILDLVRYQRLRLSGSWLVVGTLQVHIRTPRPSSGHSRDFNLGRLREEESACGFATAVSDRFTELENQMNLVALWESFMCKILEAAVKSISMTAVHSMDRQII
ncbi:aminopeptidase N-like [Penaeus indicus]|uniref:aminopeptidase N-like n=1 Tax=Penaeus indicus TaxID=29960 RepID=UPI00300C209D